MHLHLDLTTPDAGSYTYPETIAAEAQAQPEVFTGWAFVFNYPEFCATPYECGGDDFNETVKAGVYNFSGTTNQLSQDSGGEIVMNAASDGFVRLTGDVTTGQEQRPDTPPGAPHLRAREPDGRRDPRRHRAARPDRPHDHQGRAVQPHRQSCLWLLVGGRL